MTEQIPDAGPDDVPAEVPDVADPNNAEPVEPTPLDEDTAQAESPDAEAELDAMLAEDGTDG